MIANRNKSLEKVNNDKILNAQKILEKLTMCLTKDIKDGVCENFSKFNTIINKFFFFRTKIKQLKREGFVILCTVLQVFSGEISDLKKLNIKDDQRKDFELVELILNSIQLLSNFLIKLRTSPSNQTTFIECATFLILLSNMCLVDHHKKFEKPAFEMFGSIWNFLKRTNRRTTDFIASKFVFYYVLLYSRLKLTNQGLCKNLLKDYRSCTLAGNEPCQAVLVNLLLQKYLQDGMISHAEKFITKITIPERADPFQYARYNYYMGRIKVIQLQYREALINFNQALRKIPQKEAIGFKQTVLL